MENPEKSKILTLIKMGEKDLDKGAQLIHEKTRSAEREAFASWIKACCDDPKLRDLPALDASEQAKPAKADEVIRHARKSRVVDSFARNVFSQRLRCFPCHTPHEIDESNPKHQAAVKSHQKFNEELGPEVVARMSFFKETPEATMDYLVERSLAAKDGEIPLLNLKDPTQSLLLLKPLSKLPAKKADGTFEKPSSVIPTTHMGGLKMHPNDQSYKSFVAWIKDYAKVTGDQYATVGALPEDNWHASAVVLKLVAAPEAWPVGTPVQLFVHSWNAEKSSWSSDPVAFTQGTVTPRRLVNGTLFLLGSSAAQPLGTESSKVALALERGNFQVRVFVDLKNKLADDPALLFGSDEFVGQSELKNARWREGFLQAETLNADTLKK